MAKFAGRARRMSPELWIAVASIVLTGVGVLVGVGVGLVKMGRSVGILITEVRTMCKSIAALRADLASVRQDLVETNRRGVDNSERLARIEGGLNLND